jgi:hypothetical protein
LSLFASVVAVDPVEGEDELRAREETEVEDAAAVPAVVLAPSALPTHGSSPRDLAVGCAEVTVEVGTFLELEEEDDVAAAGAAAFCDGCVKEVNPNVPADETTCEPPSAEREGAIVEGIASRVPSTARGRNIWLCDCPPARGPNASSQSSSVSES